MAQAQTIRFGKAFILLSDMETSPTFTAPCGVENLTMTINIESDTVAVPDCDDPDLAVWLLTDIVSKQMTLQGSGILDTTAMQTWQDWWLSDLPAQEVNIRFFRDISAGQGGGYFAAPAVLTAYEESAQRGGGTGSRWQNSFTIALQGKPVFTPAS